MGRTNRYEKDWGGLRKKKDKKKKRTKQKPLKQYKPHDKVDEDEREVIAYEDEIHKRYSNKPVGGF
jgi:hypothetical protein